MVFVITMSWPIFLKEEFNLIMKIKVLIVDTDRNFLMTLSSYLKEKGYWIFTAENKRRVKKIIKKNNIDVVLLGIMNLKQNALSILKWVKKWCPSTEVILINSRDQLSLSIEGMKLGAFDDFLIPFDLISLDECLKKAWQLKERKRTNGSLINYYQKIMVAATYAEADEHDYAIKILKDKNSGSIETSKENFKKLTKTKRRNEK